MATTLKSKQVLATEYIFTCSSGREVTFILEAGPVYPYLFPKEGHIKLTVADLIAICEVVRNEYGKYFWLKYEGLEITIDTGTDIREQIIENLKI